MTTPKTGAPEWAASQASPHLTVNEQARRVEAGAGFYVVADKDLTAPPGSCADGAVYIVAGSPTGAWSGHAKDLAIAVGANAANGWYFRTPEEGVKAYLQDENTEYQYSGSAWASAGGLTAIADQKLLANYTGGSAVPVATSLSTVLDGVSSTRGAVLYRGASGWSALGPGTSGHVLTSNGAGADPAYAVTGAGGGGSGLTVKDEGSNITTNAVSLDFVGAGVSAVNSSGAVTVTIAGGGGTALPGTIPDLAFWFESDNILGASGAKVLGLRNRTPWYEGSIATPLSGGGATIDSGTLNGLPVANFAGAANTGYTIPLPILCDKVTVFFIEKLNAVGAYQYVFGDAANGGLRIRITDTNLVQVEKAGTATIATSSGTFNASAYKQACVTYDMSTGAYAIRIGRAADTSGTNALTLTANSSAVGYTGSNAAAFNMNAKLAAMIVYNRVLNSTEIGNVEAYLLAKWGV